LEDGDDVASDGAMENKDDEREEEEDDDDDEEEDTAAAAAIDADVEVEEEDDTIPAVEEGKLWSRNADADGMTGDASTENIDDDEEEEEEEDDDVGAGPRGV
jgi:hypothetical protein